MSNKFHVWDYIKDFAIFNAKQNISLPSELVQYIYSYIITPQISKKKNKTAITTRSHALSLKAQGAIKTSPSP